MPGKGLLLLGTPRDVAQHVVDDIARDVGYVGAPAPAQTQCFLCAFLSGINMQSTGLQDAARSISRCFLHLYLAICSTVIFENNSFFF